MPFDLRISHRHKRQLSLGLFVIFSFFLAYDVMTLLFDPDVLRSQIAVEAAIFLIGILAFRSLWISSKQEERSEVSHQQEIQKMKKEWQVDRKDFDSVIQSHFTIWDLTEAEKTIGLYLLKGLSFAEISRIRNVSERTIRNQSMAVYAKSGLSGKHELAAYFLEELLETNQKA